MAGIPVHMSSPINPHAPFTGAVAPATTTAAPDNGNRHVPASAPANTTAVAVNAYQSASPAAALPTPTSTASQLYTPSSATTPTRTVPAPPVGTRDSPPPPQPGQAPTPGATRSTSQSRNTKRPSYAEPPQPQPSSSPAQLTTPAPSYPPYTANTAAPPAMPTQAHPATTYLPPLQTSSTTYAPPSPRFRDSFAAPTSSPMTISPSSHAYPQQDLSHPPGYRQDHRASFADQPVEEVENKTHTPSPTRRGWGGLLDNEPTLESVGESPIWDTAVNWAKAAGKKLSVGEAQIWKAINGDD